MQKKIARIILDSISTKQLIYNNENLKERISDSVELISNTFKKGCFFTDAPNAKLHTRNKCAGVLISRGPKAATDGNNSSTNKYILFAPPDAGKKGFVILLSTSK